MIEGISITLLNQLINQPNTTVVNSAIFLNYQVGSSIKAEVTFNSDLQKIGIELDGKFIELPAKFLGKQVELKIIESTKALVLVDGDNKNNEPESTLKGLLGFTSAEETAILKLFSLSKEHIPVKTELFEQLLLNKNDLLLQFLKDIIFLNDEKTDIFDIVENFKNLIFSNVKKSNLSSFNEILQTLKNNIKNSTPSLACDENEKKLQADLKQIIFQQITALSDLYKTLPVLANNSTGNNSLEIVKAILNLYLKDGSQIEELSRLFKELKEQLLVENKFSVQQGLEKFFDTCKKIVKAEVLVPNQIQPIIRLLTTNLQILLLDKFESIDSLDLCKELVSYLIKQGHEQIFEQQFGHLPFYPEIVTANFTLENAQAMKADLISQVIKFIFQSEESFNQENKRALINKILDNFFEKELLNSLKAKKIVGHKQKLQLNDNKPNDKELLLNELKKWENLESVKQCLSQVKILSDLSPLFASISEPSYYIFPLFLSCVPTYLEFLHLPLDEEDAKNKNLAATKKNHFIFQITFPKLGKVRAEVTYGESDLVLNLAFEKKELLKKVKTLFPLLDERFKARGFKTIRLNIAQKNLNTDLKPLWLQLLKNQNSA